MNRQRVLVVVKQSAYSLYVEESDDPHARRLLRKRDPVVSRWRRAHDEHQRTLESTLSLLERMGAIAAVVHRAEAAFDPADARLVVVVGGDGTLLAASHNVAGVPILGINSSPSTSQGFFCGASLENLERVLPAALEGKLAGVELARMCVEVNGRVVSRRVLNEALYCHDSPAGMSRYLLLAGNEQEEQRSSGFWIGPPAGSTAAQRSAGGRVLPLGSRQLQLVVREPWAPPGKTVRLRRLLLGPGESVSVHSKMDGAAVYLDGPYKRAVVRLGDVTTFHLSQEPLRVLGLKARRSAAK